MVLCPTAVLIEQRVTGKKSSFSFCVEKKRRRSSGNVIDESELVLERVENGGGYMDGWTDGHAVVLCASFAFDATTGTRTIARYD